MPTFKEFDERRLKLAQAKSNAWRLLAKEAPNDPAVRAGVLSQLNELEEELQPEERVPFQPTRIGAWGITADSGARGLEDTQAGSVRPGYEDKVSYQRLLAVADLYALANVEKAGLYRGVAKLVELFNAGQVRLSEGDGAHLLYQIDRTKFARYSARDRMQAYSRVFGFTNVKPPAGARPNVAFRRHFLAFVQSIVQFLRDKRVSDVIRPDNRSGSYGSIATVRRTANDLRNNLKSASYGYVSVLRREVKQLETSCVDILGSSDVQNLFGTEDVWDTLEEILRRYLKQEVRVSERLQLADAGQVLIEWLASPNVSVSSGATLETSIDQIGVYAEEWLTVATALGELGTTATPARADPRNVVPMRRRAG